MVVHETIRCKKASEIIEKIVYSVNQWKQFADETAVEPKLRDAIGKAILSMRL
jgi:serine/threonine-protein kinase HipA